MMKKNLAMATVCVFAAIFLSACGSKNQKVQAEEENRSAVVEEAEGAAKPDAMANEQEWSGEDDAEEDLLHGRSLNDIRFADFKEGKDWVDNEYVRTLRRYLDDFCSRKVENEELEPFRDVLKGKFIIFNAEPFIGGGLFLSIVFYNHPQYLFQSIVYSSVDVEREAITEYHVLDITMKTDTMDITQDVIREVMSEHPEYKLW